MNYVIHVIKSIWTILNILCQKTLSCICRYVKVAVIVVLRIGDIKI